MGPFWLKIEPNNTLADPSLKLQTSLNFLQIFFASSKWKENTSERLLIFFLFKLTTFALTAKGTTS